MDAELTTTNARQLRGWCPTCRQTQPCRPQEARERNTAPSYRCDSCGEPTHDPVIRLTPPFIEASLGAGD